MVSLDEKGKGGEEWLEEVEEKLRVAFIGNRGGENARKPE